jgi:hypothetical protein
MKKSAKITLGVASVLPFAYLVSFPIFMFSMVRSAETHKGGPPEYFPLFFSIHITTMLFIFGLTIFYIVNVFSNERVPAEKKVLWMVVLFLANVFAFPFYWYFYIWSKPKEAVLLPAEEFEGGRMFCQKCGTQNDMNSYKCTGCGFMLHPAMPSSTSANGYSSIGAIIPYKNTAALTSYYFGVFSIIPGLGIVLGIAAFILGIKGRRMAVEHPEVKGVVHAWVGIILGGLFGFGYLIAAVMLIVYLSK